METLDYETPPANKGPDWWGFASMLLASVSLAAFGVLAFLILAQPRLPGEDAEGLGDLSVLAMFCCGLPGAICGIVSIKKRGPSAQAIYGVIVSLLALFPFIIFLMSAIREF
jgi:hypothetical protein